MIRLEYPDERELEVIRLGREPVHNKQYWKE
jgi:hypothetical protein